MRAPIRSRGMSMVELLVGTAVGLFVAAAGTTLVTDNLRENRRLLLEARLTQDLRTAADLVSRDLRRAGFWAAAASGVRGDDGSATASNPYAAISPTGAASDAVRFRYSRDATENGSVDANEQFGFRLRAGAVELQLGDGNWQALTDTGTLTVTTFRLEPRVEEVSLAAFCTEPCAAGSTTCPPRQLVRSYEIALAGRATADAATTRSLRSHVRLRNDPVAGTCEG